MWSFGKRTFQACRALFLTGQFSDWVGGGGEGFVGDIQLGNALYCDVSSRETCSRQMLRLARAQFWSEESVGNELNVLLVFRVTPFKIDQNKNQNRSIDKVRKLGNERRYIYKDPRQDSDQRNISYTRYPKKCFTQTYRDLYGDAMLVLTWMSSNMADGNQQKHLLPSFATKAWIYSSRNS